MLYLFASFFQPLTIPLSVLLSRAPIQAFDAVYARPRTSRKRMATIMAAGGFALAITALVLVAGSYQVKPPSTLQSSPLRAKP